MVVMIGIPTQMAWLAGTAATESLPRTGGILWPWKKDGVRVRSQGPGAAPSALTVEGAPLRAVRK